MSRPRSRGVTTMRILASVTLAMYGMVVALLALTIAFPRWGEDPHAARQPGDDFSFYLPPQVTAAVFVLLGAFALAALAGVLAARSGRGQRAGWVVALRVLVGMVVQVPVFIAVVVHGRIALAPATTIEFASVVTAAVALVLLPVAVLVATRGAGSLGRGAGG